VLALPGTNSAFTDMEVIFHEYTHLLFRHNDRLWPLWLKEGMAEVYSTFKTTGYNARIGDPIGHHLRCWRNYPCCRWPSCLPSSTIRPNTMSVTTRASSTPNRGCSRNS